MASDRKEQLRDWLAKQRYQAIIELAGRKKRVLSFLTALTYDTDPLISWRAVEVIGLAADRIAADDPEFVRNHVRRLMWLINHESGGIGWRTPETIGEILRSCPECFAEFVPILLSCLDMEEQDAVRFRAGTLWAIGRLGQVMPEAVRGAVAGVFHCLDDPNPQVRGLAAWCLGELGTAEHLASHSLLLADESLVDFYENGQLISKSVAQLARTALETSRQTG